MQEKSDVISSLWDKYFITRDNDVKNKLIMHYVPLVKSVVLRMMPAQYMHNHFDDLISCGVLGLMNAIERFDINREVKFETYAYLRIRGEIIDNLRKQDWAPSNLRRQITVISKAINELEMKLGRTATDDDIAEHVNMDVRSVQQILEKAHSFNMVYFEDMVSENYADSEAFQDNESSPQEHIEKDEMKEVLVQLIETLPQNEKIVLSLYYFEELPFKEIAKVLGVSVSRVSQIHSKTLIKMKTMIQKVYA